MRSAVVVEEGEGAMALTIGPAARAAGVNVETIRFYEREGLIARPAALDGGYRRYDAEAISAIRFIKRGQELGFTLREIKELLTLHEDECAAARKRAEEKLESVEHKIRDLERIRAALQELVRTCARSGAEEPCAILETLHSGDVNRRPRRNGASARKTALGRSRR